MQRPRAAERRNAEAGRELATVARRGVEERPFGLRAPEHRRPHHVHRAAGVDRDRRPIVRTPVDLPLVFADPRRRGKRLATVTRDGEGDVTQIPGIDVAPCRVDRAVRADRHRGLAAVADAPGQLALRRGLSRGRRRVVEPGCLRGSAGVGGALMGMARPGPAASGQPAVIEPHRVGGALPIE